MRDAAWEFLVRHIAQNPKMADTFSGVILVMQANGLYMLKVPKLVHNEAYVPLGREVSRLRDEMAETVTASRSTRMTPTQFAKKPGESRRPRPRPQRNSTMQSATARAK